ncbi:MAG: NAD(P)/FAD-dependent oxidoreductase [Bacteroidota bacterium]
MTRKEFIRRCSFNLLGLGLSFQQLGAARAYLEKPSFKGSVVIVGAGAAGLSAGFLLKQRGVDCKIIEAAPEYGGRMKINRSFADFPIALGAEWISSANMQFGQLIPQKEVLQAIPTQGYNQDEEYAIWQDGKLIRGTLNTFNDRKFVGSSWLGFFEKFILPSVQDNILYNTPVRAIDYSGEKIVLRTDKEQYTADRVILTVPVSLLKTGRIQFTPALPKKKRGAIENITYWDGFKAFFRFEKKFYPSFVDYLIQPETAGQVSLYDAAWGQKSDQPILGLFSVGQPAQQYGSLSKEAFKKQLLQELDEIFEGQASRYYINHITQNWSEEGYAQGAYVSDYTAPRDIARLRKPIADKLFFAGDAYTQGYDWGNVHNAIASAKLCVNELLNDN